MSIKYKVLSISYELQRIQLERASVIRNTKYEILKPEVSHG